MIRPLGLAVGLALSGPGGAGANDTRMHALEGHGLITTLTENGRWDATFSDQTVTYTCEECPGPTTHGRIVVRSVTEGTLTRFKTTYLKERKAWCADLATKGNGRCIGTQRVRLRPGTSAGFVSTSRISGTTHTEILIPYHERTNGPEIITATLVHPTGLAPCDLSTTTLMTHVRRLTHWW